MHFSKAAYLSLSIGCLCFFSACEQVSSPVKPSPSALQASLPSGLSASSRPDSPSSSSTPSAELPEQANPQPASTLASDLPTDTARPHPTTHSSSEFEKAQPQTDMQHYAIYETGNPSLPFILLANENATADVKSIEALNLSVLLTDSKIKVQQNAEDLQAAFNLSSLYLMQGDFEAAQKLSQSLYQKHPDFSPALYNLALTYLKLNSPEDIYQVTQTFKTKITTAPENNQNLEFAYLWSDVLNYHHLMLPIIHRPFYADYEAFIREKVDFLDDSLDLGFRNVALQTYQNALYMKFPDSQLASFKEKGLNTELFLLETQVLNFKRDFESHPEKTLSQLEELIQAYPKAALLHYQKSNFQEELKKSPSEIEASLKKTIEIAPNWTLPIATLSLFFLEQNKPEAAIQLISKAQTKANALAEHLLYLRAKAHAQLNNYSQSFEDYETFVSRYPEDYVTRTEYAFNLHKSQLSGSKERAIEQYTQIIETSPEKKGPQEKHYYDHAYTNRGILYFQLNQFESAYRDFLKLHEENPTDDTRLNLSGTLGALGRYEESIELSLKIAPDYQEINQVYRNLHQAYLRLGQCEQAKIYAPKANIILPPACPANEGFPLKTAL